mgnify:FL=1
MQIITFHGDVETTSYFLTQIEKQLRKDGYEVCPFYFDTEKKTAEGMGEIRQGAYFLTFNFAGLYGGDTWLDDGKDIPVVDRYALYCINIIVDHPYHYHDFMQEQLKRRGDRYMQICIDQLHMAYMQRYFPQIKLGPFLPAAGTELLCRPWKERKTDLLFTGTYVCPSHFDVFINRNGEEYSRFYHSIIDEVLADPQQLLENVARRRLVEEIPEVTEEEIRETLGHIQFLDYYIRFTLRGNVVAALADAGLKIHIIGAGWENLPCRHPENLILSPYVSSEECLLALADAKLALNVLPCFHAGAHDRIFNTMLAGAVCVTDSNAYLDQILIDEENVILYDREEPEKLAERLAAFLQPQMDEKLQQIADRGRKLALTGHTWEARTKILEGIL